MSLQEEWPSVSEHMFLGLRLLKLAPPLQLNRQLYRTELLGDAEDVKEYLRFKFCWGWRPGVSFITVAYAQNGAEIGVRDFPRQGCDQ
jgi:hypothetical protein